VAHSSGIVVIAGADAGQWFLFSVSERWREDDSEYEHFTDSAGVGFVDNPSGSYSRLQSLTIAEYKRRRQERLTAVPAPGQEGPAA